MALTQTQALDGYILDSAAMFLARNVKAPYDTAAAALTTATRDISKALTVMQAKPTDSALALSPPSIGIDDFNGGTAADFPLIGVNTSYRYMNIILYCYPAINAVNGEPNSVAEKLLKGILRNALSTYSFKVIDYSNPSCNSGNILYCDTNILIDKFSHPMNRGRNSPNALERNRFDINVSLCYEVDEVLVS